MSRDSERPAIDQMIAEWAQATRQGGEAGADGYASFATEDAIFLPPDLERVEGRAAIREVALGYTSLPGFDVDWRATWVHLADDGRHADVIGEFEITMDGPDGDAITVPGKFFDLFEKQSDGRWLAKVACWNSNRPAG